MTRSRLTARKPRRFWLRNVLGCLCLLMGLAGGTGGCRDGMSQLAETQRLAVDVRIQLNLAATASIRAVMAKTDPESIGYAREAEQAKQALKKDVETMLPKLRELSYVQEAQLLEAFSQHFAEYEAIDRSILELAVENTNLKAQQLSFTPAWETGNRLRAALEAVARTTPPKNRCRVDSLIASAVQAVLEIQVLHAPHIAESSEAAMAAMEKEMTDRMTAAQDALSALSSLIEPSAQDQLKAAMNALAQFQSIHLEVIKLSRRNSNARSLELALGQERALTATCDTSISALQAALAKAGVRPTR